MNKVKDICQDCGKVYNAGRYSFFCPKCRKRRKSQNAKRINLSISGQMARRVEK